MCTMPWAHCDLQVRAVGGLKPVAGGEAKALAAALSETERIELSRALGVVHGAYQTNELVCQGLRHVYGVREPEDPTPMSLAWRSARLSLRDVNARLRLFALRFATPAWKPSWKTFSWEKDLCADAECKHHVHSRLYDEWVRSLSGTCSGMGPSGSGTYCCTRRLTKDDDAVCPAGQPCARDENLAIGEGKRKGAAYAPPTYAQNAIAIFGCPATSEDTVEEHDTCDRGMEAIVGRLVDGQVAMSELLSRVPTPEGLSKAEQGLIAGHLQQVGDVGRELRGLSHKLNVEVSRAAQFARAYSHNLEGRAPGT